MFKIVSDGSIGKSLKETFNGTHSWQIRFVKKSGSHGSRNIEKDDNGFFGFSGNDWDQIFFINFNFSVLSIYSTAHEIKIVSFFIACGWIKEVERFKNVLVFADVNSEPSFFGLQK